ncbi:MAG: response regulator [Anaerolineaceae bacterium]
MRVLYVEDNPFDADLTRRTLANDAPDIDLTVAQKLSEATLLVDENFSNPFHCILTDLRLPDGTGLDLLRYLRKNNILSAVVIITGQGDEQTVLTAIKSGADDYIPKRKDYLQEIPGILNGAVQRYRKDYELKKHLLRVLYAEHLASDVDLTLRHLATYAPFIHLEVVKDGKAVLDLMKLNTGVNKWDVILLDYRLAGVNALEVLRELNQLEDHPPVIIVTGQGDEEVAISSLRLGAADYLIKNPGYLYQLVPTLQNAYHRNQLEKEQAALDASEERFHRLVQNVQDLIYRFHFFPEPGFDYVSPAATELTGFSPEEFYADGNLAREFILEKDEQFLEEIKTGNVDFSSPLLMRWRRKDGKMVWIEDRSSPVYNSAGQLIALEGIARDITARMEADQALKEYSEKLEGEVKKRTAELIQAQEQVLRQERQATFGRLASAVAHELRNPLGVISNSVYFLRLKLEPMDEKVSEYLKIMDRECQEAVRILSDLINYSNLQAGDRYISSSEEIVEQSIKLSPIPEKILLNKRFARDLKPVFVDADQIEQVLARLLDNAYQAMENGGTISIRVKNCMEKQKPMVLIKLTDEGCGFTADQKEHLFEPLFTTKPRHIGLGLPIAKRLVEVNGGKLELESTEGKGTCVTLYLPVRPE